ncbi:O-antigen polysaccharide polymerase Wzy [Photobacterium satsumensis]|uniref:O-antigen polysaccharide polymerase Wzy n=1 Tax=Photobacterium satsumensis TaxID=2910239 RepID=UPI003D0A54B8
MGSLSKAYNEERIRLSSGVFSLFFGLFLLSLWLLNLGFDFRVLVITYSMLVLFALIKKFGILSFYALLYSTFILFYVSRYLIDLFSDFNVREFTFFFPMRVEDEVLYQQNVLLLCFSFACILTGFLVSEKRYTRIKKIENNSNYGFLKICALTASLFYIAKYIIILRVTGFDYIYFQSNYVEVLNQVPFVVRVVATLSTIIYFCFLSSINSHKNFIIYSALFLFISVFALLQGGRAEFITNFIVVIWLYGKKFEQHKLNVVKLLPLFLLGITLLYIVQFMASFRLGQEAASGVLFSLLRDQGTSLIIVPLSTMFSSVLSYSDFLEHILRFFISPFYGLFYKLNITVNYNSVIEVISQYINPTAGLHGFGLGGSLLAELYLYFGFLGVILVTPIVFWCYSLFFNIRPDVPNWRSIFIFSLCLIAMKSIFFVMRGYSFEFVSELIRHSFYILPFILFCWFMRLISINPDHLGDKSNDNL